MNFFTMFFRTIKKNVINFEVNGTLWIILIAILILFSTEAKAQSDTIQTNVPALKNVYAHDFTIGCILSYRHVGFPNDPYVQGQSAIIAPNGGNLVKFHMNSISPGNNMKAQYTIDITNSAADYNAATTQHAKDSIETHPVVRFNGDLIAQLNWAKRQGFTFRGHVLVWHSQTPPEFFRSGYVSNGARLTKVVMTERMDSYIKEVIRLLHESWPGLLSAMDVVNEAINDNGTDRTTDSEWYITFGDNSYIMKAFELARKYTLQYGETQMILYYNDYNTSNSNKADGIVRICKPIFQAGYLDGIGMQEHDNTTSPTAENWIKSYNKFDAICSEMAVTELDISTGYSSPPAFILSLQANQYAMLFKCFVERSYKSGRGKIINVSKDGLNDQYTFVTNSSTSLWDSKNQCKPAFYSVVEVGINYNLLDSLIKYADLLKQNEYTAESWLNFTNALTFAKNTKIQNFSNSIPASTTLGLAKDSLMTAINKLAKNVVAVDNLGVNNLKTFVLHQNYPNPFNPTTTIEFSVPIRSNVHIEVLNTLGQIVEELVNENFETGIHNIIFDASKLSSGIYLYRMQAGDFIGIRKLILMK